MSHHTDADRDSGRHRFADVPATASDYVTAAVGGHAVELRTSFGVTTYAHTAPGQSNHVHVIATGPGGGFIWERTWPRAEYRRYVERVLTPDAEVRRGPVDEVVPDKWR